MSSTADALPPVDDDIPWSSSSSSSGGIPEFSTRAWPIEQPLRSEIQMVLDHLHQSIPTMHPDPQPQSTPDSTTQARLEASRRGTVVIITRYRLIMERAEFLRITRVSRNSRRWMARHTLMFGLTFARNVQQRLVPFIRRVTDVTRLYFWRLDQLCEGVAGQVQAAESNQALTWRSRTSSMKPANLMPIVKARSMVSSGGFRGDWPGRSQTCCRGGRMWPMHSSHWHRTERTWSAGTR